MLRETLARFLHGPARHLRDPGTIWALRDVSFSVSVGEVVGIIGRNGAGKSTLLKLLSRITYPTTGSVIVRGRAASLLEVGTGFHEELTGRENIYLNGSILGMRKREVDAKLDEIVAFAAVEEFLDTPVKRYSSGMRMRLGFAVAAHLDPDVLLVDEVLAVGDMQFQKKCMDTMGELRAGGRTVLLVSHSMAAIMGLCPRTIWIDNGQVRRDGPTSDVIKEYMSTFAKAQQGGSSLEHLEARTGTGECRFTRVEFLDGTGQPTDHVSSGDRVTIRVHFRADTDIRDLRVGLEIHSEMGLMVVSTTNSATGNYVHQVSAGRHHIDLEIDFLNLLPGRYYLSLYLGRFPDYQDCLQNAVFMDLEPADFYGTGRGLDRRFGFIFLPCRWRFDGME